MDYACQPSEQQVVLAGYLEAISYYRMIRLTGVLMLPLAKCKVCRLTPLLSTVLGRHAKYSMKVLLWASDT